MKTQNVIGALLVIFGFTLLWFFAAYGFGNFAFYVGQVLGQSIIIVPILLLLLAITPLKKRVALLLVIGVVCFGSAGLMSVDLYEKGLSERKIAKTAIELLDSISSGGNIVPDNISKKSTSVEDWMKGYMSRVQQISIQFTNEIEATDLGSMLAPENLAEAGRAKKAKVKIAHLKQSISEYESRILEEMKLAEDELSKMKDSAGQAAYRGFLKSKQDGIAKTKKYVEIERAIVDSVGKVLDLSIGLEGKLHVKSGQLLFEDQRSLGIYNGYLSDINSLSIEESKLLHERQQRIENTKKEMQDAL